MPWPALAELVKAYDVAIYQNKTYSKPNWQEGRIPWPETAAQHPEVKVIFVRVAGNKGGPDWDFQYNYDGALEVGYKTAIYGFASPGISISTILNSWWKPGLDGRKPKLIVLDCEIANGKTPAEVTKHIRDLLAAIRREWPGVEVWLYSADWWWSGNIVHGWENEEKFWWAHYVHIVQNPNGTWRVAWSFEEVDSKLPISNNFTPYMGTSKVLIANVEAWQLSSGGIVYPITRPIYLDPRVDLTYMRLSAYTRIWGEVQPPPPPVTEPIPVRIEVPRGKTLVTVEEV
jgi:hypothetical protein